MTIRNIPSSLKRWSRLIAEFEDYRHPETGGDGFYVHLVPGFICTATETHTVHKANITQCVDVFKSGAVQPCDCAECQKLIARQAALAEEDPDERKWVLFSSLPLGLQATGEIIADLGWSSFHITETTGIEGLIGLKGFTDEYAFKEYLEVALEVPLNDWDACQLTLHSCWFQLLSERDQEESDPDFCYSSWRITPDADAIKSTPTNVFAVRHKTWPLLGEGRIKAFHCARQRSYAETTWAKLHPAEEITPQIMSKTTDTGFYLTGRNSNGGAALHLTWPTPDLVTTLVAADAFDSQGIMDITLWEGGFGCGWSDLPQPARQRLLKAFSYYGEEMGLLDLASASGIR